MDRVEQVTNEEAIEMARRLAREEGMLSRHLLRRRDGGGVAPGARTRTGGKTIVVILPDAGERYLSGALFEGLFEEVEKMQAVA